MTTHNFSFFYLQPRLIQTSQTGGQRYSDTSPFSIPWLVAPAKTQFEKQSLVVCTKQSKQADKAGRLTRQGKAGRLKWQAGWQGRQDDKAGRMTRQTGCQSRQADKAGQLTREAGWPGSQADKADRLTRQPGLQGSQTCLICFRPTACIVLCPLRAPLFSWSGCFTK